MAMTTISKELDAGKSWISLMCQCQILFLLQQSQVSNHGRFLKSHVLPVEETSWYVVNLTWSWKLRNWRRMSLVIDNRGLPSGY